MDLAARFDRLDRFVAEGRIVRGQWGDGEVRACLLLAIAPEVGGGVISACPASVIPPWLAELTPSIDDDVAAADWHEIITTYARVVRLGAERLDDAGWRRALARFLIAVLDDLVVHDTANVVEPVAALWRRVLDGDEPTGGEWLAAEAAAWTTRATRGASSSATLKAEWAAAEAAQAATSEALGLTDTARDTALSAAEAVTFLAASEAAEATDATWARDAAGAREAAWSRIARHLFASIEAETVTLTDT